MSLTQDQVAIIKSCVPILEQHGLTITKTFYSNMIDANPCLRDIFSNTHQATGHQALALANSLHAYASNIDNLAALGPVVELICHKHVSLHVEPQHYDIVGSNLLAAMGQILGDALTPEVLEAWTVAYGQLAKIMIDREKQMYDAFGAWDNWRDMKIVKKVRETEAITSFYLVPVDDTEGKMLPKWKPGQYISVRVPVEDLGFKQPRQYSLSDVAGKGYLRISVKREAAAPSLNGGKSEEKEKVVAHPGFVSNLLHESYDVDDVLEATHPTGDFFYEEAVAKPPKGCPFHNSNNNAARNDNITKEEKAPLFLLSSGVGITPMIAILNSQIDSPDRSSVKRPITFVHGAANHSLRPFTSHLSSIQENTPSNDLQTIFFNSQDSKITSGSARKVDSPIEQKSLSVSGRVNLDQVRHTLEGRGLSHPEAQFFICGPEGFMDNMRRKLVDEYKVEPSRVYLELFGTGGRGAVQA